jgi:hypothetical protein
MTTQEETKATFPQKRKLWWLTGNGAWLDDATTSEAWAGREIRRPEELKEKRRELQRGAHNHQE